MQKIAKLETVPLVLRREIRTAAARPPLPKLFPSHAPPLLSPLAASHLIPPTPTLPVVTLLQQRARPLCSVPVT